MKFATIIGVIAAAVSGALWLWSDRDRAVVISTPLPDPMIYMPPPIADVSLECDVVVGASVSSIAAGDVSPGDVVCLTGGTRGPLHIRGVSGTAADPIVFTNHGDVTVVRGDHSDYAGIDITDSAHLVITGTGVASRCGASVDRGDQRCGIVVTGTGRGIAATERTDHVKVDHVEIVGTSHSGIFMKTGADEGTTRDEWTQHGTQVVDNYLHGVGREGLYIGSSFYSEGIDPVLSGVEASRNLIIESGWDGLQVGSAVEDCEIRGNRVIRAGTEDRDDQRSGIINNRGSVCDILDNVVVGSAAQGIFVQGNGGNLVGNNLILQPGWRTSSEGDGITVTRGSNTGVGVEIVHNTIVGAPRAGVRFRNDLGEGNLVANNLVVATRTTVDVEDPDVLVSHNVVAPTLDTGGFVDPWNSDYRLAAGSPAIDAGMDLPDPLTSDLTGWPRPEGEGYDAGSFEYRDEE